MHLILIFLFVLHAGWLKGFEKVVIWGHKIHSHTHSYIHQGFYDAFTYLGYDTYWFDNNDEVSSFDFSGALFLTEGQVDQKIPLRKDGVYVLHNCDGGKYAGLHFVSLQVYTDSVLKQPNLIQIEPCIYFNIAGRELIFPWATNLFPEEIEKIKQSLPTVQKERAVYWIGTVGEGAFGNVAELEPFIRACQENEIPFIAPNACATGISAEEHQRLITSAYLAPAIVGEWQKRVGYIPCRIFKNISYGQMGITNSRQVYELFDRKIVYNPDPYQLFYEAQERLKTIAPEEIFVLMDIVKAKHTYLNRVNTLLSFLKLLGTIDENKPIHNLLESYKELLEWGTYEGQDWSSLSQLPKSRYETFCFVFEHLKTTGGKLIVELGTSRSFTHGGHPGCNSDDRAYWDPLRPEIWDWGAGFFTRMAAVALSDLSPEIHTVDLIAAHIERCKWITRDFSHCINYHVSPSVEFLKNCHFAQGIDLIYLDTGDITPIELSALLQLEEVKIIVERGLLSETGLILIDDVKNRTPKKFGETSDLGKSKYSLPFLLANGYEILMDEYQVVVQKCKK